MKKVAIFLLILSLASCASKKDVWYFQDIDEVPLMNIDSIKSQVQIHTNDILYIRVSALDAKSVLPFKFQKPMAGNTTPRNAEMIKLNGYLVDSNGNITYPQLGEIHVEGKTPTEIENILKEKISNYVVNPTVSVRLVNFTISIIGDVKQPGTYTLSEASVTLPQALGLAGDLTINGQRHDILIIRTKGDKRIYKHIDLTESEWMNSPFYYLKQNDIVYVKPNNPKVKTAGFIGSVGNVLSVASILLSAAVIIFR